VATYVMTGAAGGMGVAARTRLEADGHRFIGVDLRDADVIADLSTPSGRAGMVAEVTALAGRALDGVIAGAGVTGPDGATVAAVNYFGAVATLQGLRPLLAASGAGAAVAISSNSTTTFPGLPTELVGACLDGDEDHALAIAANVDALAAYPASKLALARWVRRSAPADAWVGAGITLNAIAPGLISTPMTHGMEDAVLGLGDVYPVPVGRAGKPEEIADLLAYVLTARFLCGSVVFIDGGTDASLRSDSWPREL
jgi:NAD(P)-dependent dehydrogenase (short-subunit alcohol dehydrogenase family)